MPTTQNLMGIITIFILAILGLVLIGPIADQINTLTSTQSVTNETVTFLNNTNSSLANGNITNSSITITNSSGTTLSRGNFTAFPTAGIIFWNMDNNSRSLNNTLWNVSYSFQGADFIESSTTRTILDLIIIFFALGVFGWVIYGFMRMGKEFLDLGK